MLPLALTPEIEPASPLMTACAPLTMSRNWTPVDCILGFAKRLNASAKLFAVTGLAVREPEALPDGERVRLAVLRDERQPRCHLGRGDGAGRALLVRPVEELARRGALELPRLAVVRELRIDVVDVGRHVDDDGAAPLGARRGSRGRDEQEGQARDRERDPEQALAVHVAPFRGGSCWFEGHRDPRGSNASRSPSPSRLKASVVRSSAIPGHTMRSGREV